MAGRAARRLLAGVVCVLSAVSCTSHDDGDATVLRWDLSRPMTTRDLGSRFDWTAVVEAPPGGMLDVELALPHTFVSGEYTAIMALPVDVTDGGVGEPVGLIQLTERRVDSVAGLRALIDRFDDEWPMPDSERAKADGLLDELAANEAISGRITLDDYPIVMSWGFNAGERDGVQASLTIGVESGEFSAYRALRLTDIGPLLLFGCASGTAVSVAACDAATTVLSALGVPAGEADGVARETECTDGLGSDSGEVYAVVDTGVSVPDGTVTDAALDALPGKLGLTPLNDFRQEPAGSEPGARMVVVNLSMQHMNVRVTMRLDDTGVFSLSAETDCR